MTLALGGDCLADIAVLRAEPALFGPVASDPVVSRLVARLAGDAPRALKAIRAARAAARGRAWELAGESAPGADGGRVTAAAASGSPPGGPGHSRSPPRSTASRLSHPANQPRRSLPVERTPPGPVEPRHTGQAAGTPG